MPSCAIATCSNYSRKTNVTTRVKYHRFPRNLGTLKLWLDTCRRKDPVNVMHARVCSVHFSADAYARDLKSELLGLPKKLVLKPDAVPSLMLPEISEDIFPEDADAIDTSVLHQNSSIQQSSKKKFKILDKSVRIDVPHNKIMKLQNEVAKLNTQTSNSDTPVLNQTSSTPQSPNKEKKKCNDRIAKKQVSKETKYLSPRKILDKTMRVDDLHNEVKELQKQVVKLDTQTDDSDTPVLDQTSSTPQSSNKAKKKRSNRIKQKQVLKEKNYLSPKKKKILDKTATINDPHNKMKKLPKQVVKLNMQTCNSDTLVLNHTLTSQSPNKKNQKRNNRIKQKQILKEKNYLPPKEQKLLNKTVTIEEDPHNEVKKLKGEIKKLITKTRYLETRLKTVKLQNKFLNKSLLSTHKQLQKAITDKDKEVKTEVELTLARMLPKKDIKTTKNNVLVKPQKVIEPVKTCILQLPVVQYPTNLYFLKS